MAGSAIDPEKQESVYDPSCAGDRAASQASHAEVYEKFDKQDFPSATSSALAPSEERIKEDLDQQPVVRTVSTQSRAPPVVKVPLAERTGLLARLSLLYEAEVPQHYPRNVRWLITFIISLAGLVAPMGSAIILPALNDINDTFGSSPTVGNLSVSLYLLSMSIFPLWWSSASEVVGRRAVYIVSFALFVLFTILSAISNSIGMFIIMRFLNGGASASVQAVGAGTVSDIWEVRERGKAMGIFYLGPLCGPLLTPIVGGALTDGLGWRSTQWFQAIFGFIVLLAIVFALPETHKRSALKADAEREAEAREARHEARRAEKAQQQQSFSRPTVSRTISHRSAGADSVAVRTSRRYFLTARRILVDPFHMLAYLRFPPVALLVYYASIAFGSLYCLNISIETTFSKSPYNFSSVIVGCLYLFNSTGYFLSSILGGRWVDKIMHRNARRAGRVLPSGKLQFRPEDRIGENMWVAAVLMPGALLWYAWSAEKRVFFVVPMIANFFFGVGSMLVFAGVTTMLTEFMPQKTSSGVALNNFMRNIFSFVGSFVANPGIEAIGNGWLFTIIALIALLSGAIIPLMKHFGERWRADMDRRMR